MVQELAQVTMLRFLKSLFARKPPQETTAGQPPVSGSRAGPTARSAAELKEPEQGQSLTERIQALRVQIEKIKPQADNLAAEFKRHYEEANARQDELVDLVSSADDEATQMRSCFQRSQEAYLDRDGANAKVLSNQGKEHQEIMNTLNEQAQEIREIGKRGQQKEAECRDRNLQLKGLFEQEAKLKSIRTLCRSRKGSWNSEVDQRLGTCSDRVFGFLAKLNKDDPAGLEVFIRGLANPALDQELACELPTALVDLLGGHPSAAGLLHPLKNRGPGATAWAANLCNRSAASAAGTAYEVLAARRLMDLPAGDLQVLPTDQLSFGPKQQARYMPDTMKTRDLLVALVNDAASRWASVQSDESAIARRTVEADLLLSRQDGVEISIDFKHSTVGSACHLGPGQLLGVAVALATGEISESHFVANTSFDKITLDRVDDINRVMTKWNCGRTFLHPDYSWRDA